MTKSIIPLAFLAMVSTAVSAENDPADMLYDVCDEQPHTATGVAPNAEQDSQDSASPATAAAVDAVNTAAAAGNTGSKP